eukprot:29252_1
MRGVLLLKRDSYLKQLWQKCVLRPFACNRGRKRRGTAQSVRTRPSKKLKIRASVSRERSNKDGLASKEMGPVEGLFGACTCCATRPFCPLLMKSGAADVSMHWVWSVSTVLSRVRAARSKFTPARATPSW